MCAGRIAVGVQRQRLDLRRQPLHHPRQDRPPADQQEPLVAPAHPAGEPARAAHAGVGLASGLLFGGPLLALTFQAMPQLTAAAVVARSVNELFFPVGCALVLYASDTLGKRLA